MDQGDIVQKHRDAFIVVKGREGSGSGFICRLGGKPWLFTNIHVAAGMHDWHLLRLDATQIAPGPADTAAGRDILRMALNPEVRGTLEVMSNLEANARIGDEVVVLGNSGGGGGGTSLAKNHRHRSRPHRSHRGVHSRQQREPDHSHQERQVIGIATYLTKRYEEFSGGPLVRRFGFRLDNVPTWESINRAVFQSEAEQIKRIEALTGDAFDCLRSLRQRTEPAFDTETLRRPATEWLAIIRKSKLSRADRDTATARFLGELRFMVRGDVARAEILQTKTMLAQTLNGMTSYLDPIP